MSIAQVLKSERAAAKKSLPKLQQETGLSTGYLSRIENAQQIPAAKHLRKLAQALGADPETLIDERDKTELIERHGLPPEAAEAAVSLRRLSQPATDDDHARVAHYIRGLRPEARAQLRNGLTALLGMLDEQAAR